MATGNKPVKGRTNKRKAKIGKRGERRGGRRPGAGQPKKHASARKTDATKPVRKDARAEFLDLLEAQSKKQGKHRFQVFVDILHEKKWEKFRSTNAGAKAVSQLIDVVFFNQSSGRTPGPGPPPPDAGEDEPELSGPPKLGPMKPDPALKKKVA